MGVDGCRGGWIAVADHGQDPPRVEIFPTFPALIAAAGNTAIVAVDMPIGLPATIGREGRGPEKAVRLKLGSRRSSVFSVPSRAAIFAGAEMPASGPNRLSAHRHACEVARQTSDPPRAVSIQAFGLFAKIREVDAAVTRDGHVASRVHEAHPELAFATLNGGTPMRHPKKKAGRLHLPGLAERRALLLRAGVSEAFFAEPLPKGAGEDDGLDALVLMLVARRIWYGEAVSHPDPPLTDERGLRIAIWA